MINDSNVIYQGMPEGLELISGFILFAANLILILIHFYEWVYDRKLMKTGTEVSGEIIDTVTYPDDDNLQSGQYRFLAEFKVNNISYQTISRFASTSKNKFLNNEVVIIYDPHNPSHSRFKYDKDLLGKVVLNLVLIVLGLGLLIYGLLK